MLVIPRLVLKLYNTQQYMYQGFSELLTVAQQVGPCSFYEEKETEQSKDNSNVKGTSSQLLDSLGTVYEQGGQVI